MNVHAIAARMEAFPPSLESLVRGLAPEALRFRPAPEAWSIAEVVGHLLDEEAEDFRPRLRATLENPTRPWPAIDPEGWVRARGHQAADPAALVARFSQQREHSVAWLRSLGEPDWSTAYLHPSLGALRAGDLLAAWAVHDALHTRQIAQRLYQLAQRDTDDFVPDYAGPWGR